MATPVLLLVVIYLIYALIAFRQPRRGAALEGARAARPRRPADDLDRRSPRVIVLLLPTYGTVRL